MLKPEDSFRVECAHSISEDGVVSLLNLYQPLIKGDGVLLYLTLHAEARHARSQSTHKHLCTLMNIPLDTLERARYRLEQFSLLRTYIREGEHKDAYIYHLNTPLPTEDFLSNQVFTSAFISAVGKKDSDEIIQRLGSIGISMQGFRDVTKPYVHMPTKYDVPSAAYTPVRPRYSFSAEDVNINFDYSKFFATTSDLVFPVELRTEENLALIGKLATIYGISADRMRELVKQCVLINPARFEAERLKLRCEKEKVEYTKGKDIYSLPPASFLQSKMNGRPVPLPDKKILEHLSLDMHFSNEVINVMIEYILKISNNRLTAKFVDMIAGEWARDGIETKEQALLETQKPRTYKNQVRQSVKLPAYKTEKQEETAPMDETQLEALRKLKAKMK